mgnify:CR=1 FL=1
MVIFGTGYHGRAAYRACKNNKIKVIAFIDNDKKKIGKKIFGIKILSANKVNEIDNNENLILCGRNIKDQLKQLSNLVNRKKIIIWGSSKLTPPKKSQPCVIGASSRKS